MLRSRPHTQQLVTGQFEGFNNVEFGAQDEVVEFVGDLQAFQFKDRIHRHNHMVLLCSDPARW